MKKLEENLSPYLNKKNLKQEEGKLGKALLSAVEFLQIWTFFFKHNFIFNNDREVTWFHTFPSNIGVTPIFLSH